MLKSLPLVISFMTNPALKRNFAALAKLLTVFVVIVSVYTVTFHVLMEREGQTHSWATGVYWVLVVMSTLGFGDITFTSDLGRIFSVVVLLSGSIFMLVLLPFMFIQFFYVPWMEAQAAARAPRKLDESTRGHVILTGKSALEQTFIAILNRTHHQYVLLVADLQEALRLHDEGYRVMVGELDDQATYQRAQAGAAAMVVAAQRDTTNSNIAFTVREISEEVKIVATASSEASLDVLELAGCDHVLQLGEMLGNSLARRVVGRDAKCREVGAFGELIIAEASVHGTPLVGRTLKQIRLNEHTQVNVIGVWDRGRFSLAGPDTLIEPSTVLLLAGKREDLDEYNGLFCVYGTADASVIIIGGGRVGRATAKGLKEAGIKHVIIEQLPERIRDETNYLLGNAADFEVLEQAGIRSCSTVVITSHDDDMNIYLAIYCRKLRPNVQILVRANQDRNVSTLHRAGADFVMSYASAGATSLYNILQRGSLLLLADGLDVFRVSVPVSLVGKTLAECRFRQTTGCNVVAITHDGEAHHNPDPHRPFSRDDELILVGDTESEQRFYKAID